MPSSGWFGWDCPGQAACRPGPAWAGSAGRPQLGDLVLLPVPSLFGSEVAVFFHMKTFGFVLQGSNKFHTVHNAFLIFQRLLIAAFDF